MTSTRRQKAARRKAERDLARSRLPRVRKQRAIYVKRRRRDPETWGATMLPSLRWRAKKMRVNFSLVAGDIVVPEFCPVLRIKLDPAANCVAENSPSIDRHDNLGGYVLDNIFVISHRANHLKWKFSAAELRAKIEREEKLLSEFRAVLAYIERPPVHVRKLFDDKHPAPGRGRAKRS